jgi:hypothetical protein
MGALRERLLTASWSIVSDELYFKSDASEEILEIHTSRRKEGWTPPRVVRIRDSYYKLEADSFGLPPRPFRYMLRRLPAGVPGRTVLLYSPADAVIKDAS